MAGDCDASRLDLLAGHRTAGEGLQTEFSEGERVAALGVPGAGTLHRFTVFGTGRSESHGWEILEL
jgi:hypothetical protein